MKITEVLKGDDYTLRCRKTLVILGHWFEVDGVIYKMLKS